jgi:c-di-GMP-binding flagellar brake protein YcgR
MSESLAVPFEAGQVVILGVGPDHARRWYRTSVEKVDERMVWLDGAPPQQPAVDVQPGEQVICHTWRSMDALYEAEARIAFTRLGSNPLVGITVLKAERIQQREYVRIPLSAVATGLYLGTEAFDLAQPKSLKLDVYDLSASGFRARGDLPLNLGDEITVDLKLPRADSETEVPLHLRGRVVALPDLPEPLNLRARVVRLVEAAHAGERSHEIGVTFVNVSREARERIIRYALEVQRDRRRRGMM